MTGPAATTAPCCVCAAPGGNKCTSCRARHYCSKKCQLVDWKRGHSKACPDLAASQKSAVDEAADVGASPAGRGWPDWRGNCALCSEVLAVQGACFSSCCAKKTCAACYDAATLEDKRCPVCRSETWKSEAEWFQRMDKHVVDGNAEAQVVLAASYRDGLMGLTIDLKQAFRLYTLAAAQGSAEAQDELGRCYGSGHGVAMHLETAAQLHRRAADQGLPSAQYHVGVLFYEGRGVAQSQIEAATWFGLSAAQGHAGSLSNLGACHANGHGGHADAAAAADKLEYYLAKRYGPIPAAGGAPSMAPKANPWADDAVKMVVLSKGTVKPSLPHTAGRSR
ncbi:hypothetical protein M885DRAFT_571208 [Pelagophyceae sp. CCMP2097]|nr:hypothetical protein M885DRAFT_571208 [Pelagophyceae sp. CCMP2097]